MAAPESLDLLVAERHQLRMIQSRLILEIGLIDPKKRIAVKTFPDTVDNKMGIFRQVNTSVPFAGIEPLQMAGLK